MLADVLIWMTLSVGADERRFEFGSTVRAIFASFPVDPRYAVLLMTMPYIFVGGRCAGLRRGRWRKTVGVPHWFVWLKTVDCWAPA